MGLTNGDDVRDDQFLVPPVEYFFQFHVIIAR